METSRVIVAGGPHLERPAPGRAERPGLAPGWLALAANGPFLFIYGLLEFAQGDRKGAKRMFAAGLAILVILVACFMWVRATVVPFTDAGADALVTFLFAFAGALAFWSWNNLRVARAAFPRPGGSGILGAFATALLALHPHGPWVMYIVAMVLGTAQLIPLVFLYPLVSTALIIALLLVNRREPRVLASDVAASDVTPVPVRTLRGPARFLHQGLLGDRPEEVRHRSRWSIAFIAPFLLLILLQLGVAQIDQPEPEVGAAATLLRVAIVVFFILVVAVLVSEGGHQLLSGTGLAIILALAAGAAASPIVMGAVEDSYGPRDDLGPNLFLWMLLALPLLLMPLALLAAGYHAAASRVALGFGLGFGAACAAAALTLLVNLEHQAALAEAAHRRSAPDAGLLFVLFVISALGILRRLNGPGAGDGGRPTAARGEMSPAASSPATSRRLAR